MSRRSNSLMLMLRVLAGALMLVAGPGLADQTKCEAAQMKGIGKFTSSLYACLSRGESSGNGAGECVASASNRFSGTLAKIEDKDGCEIPDDFSALDLGLQTAITDSAYATQDSLSAAWASIEPCTTGYSERYEVELLKESELRVRVDTIDDTYYFNPRSALTGVTNATCVAGDRILEQLNEFEFRCTYDPQGIVDVLHPDGFCPEFTITSGAAQTCEITVAIESSCEDVSAPTRGDYRLEVLIDNQPGFFTKTASDVAP